MEINFIPVKLRPKRPSRAPYLFASMIYISALLFFGSRAGTVNQLKRGAVSDRELAATLNSNLAIYRDSREKLDRVNKNARELIAGKMAFQDAYAKKAPLGRIIGEISRVTPEGLRYEELEISYPSDKFILQGFGEQMQEKLIALRYSLEASSVIGEHFERIGAASSGAHPNSDKVRTFEIELDFRQ